MMRRISGLALFVSICMLVSVCGFAGAVYAADPPAYAQAYIDILEREPIRESEYLHTFGGNVAIADVFGDSIPELIYVSYRSELVDSELVGDGEVAGFWEHAYLNICTYENGTTRQIAALGYEGGSYGLNGQDVYLYDKVFLTAGKDLYIYKTTGQDIVYDGSYTKCETVGGKLVKTDKIERTPDYGNFDYENLDSVTYVYNHNGTSISKAEYEALEKSILSSAVMLLETTNDRYPFESGTVKNYEGTASLKRVGMTYDQAIQSLRSLGGAVNPAAPAGSAAAPTASTVLVNGKSIAFDAYNIGGNNYFKLRDLAYTLNGTPKQFEVGWDGAANAIALTSGQAYTAAGGEMAGKGAGGKTATPTTSKITLDGKDVSLTAYNIGGNNYFKLRDIGQAFDFGVDWDGARNTIVIDTGKGYTPE